MTVSNKDKKLFLEFLGLEPEEILEQEDLEKEILESQNKKNINYKNSPKTSDSDLFLEAFENGSYLNKFESKEEDFKVSKSNNNQSRLNKAGSKVSFEAFIDLHGLRRLEAVNKLEHFIKYTQSKKMRKVLVIHGKGSGALQEEVRDYLSRDNRIASVMSAPGKLGGAGAVIVYLRT